MIYPVLLRNRYAYVTRLEVILAVNDVDRIKTLRFYVVHLLDDISRRTEVVKCQNTFRGRTQLAYPESHREQCPNSLVRKMVVKADLFPVAVMAVDIL